MGVSLAKGIEVIYTARVELSHADGSLSSIAWMNDEPKSKVDAFVDATIGARVRQKGEWSVTTMQFHSRVIHVLMETSDKDSSGIIITVTSRVAPIRRT